VKKRGSEDEKGAESTFATRAVMSLQHDIIELSTNAERIKTQILALALALGINV